MLTVREGFYDEMLEADGTPRPHAQTLVHALEQLGPEALSAAGRRRDAIFMQQGITFDAGGPGDGLGHRAAGPAGHAGHGDVHVRHALDDPAQSATHTMPVC